jgi:hypothetical protein
MAGTYQRLSTDLDGRKVTSAAALRLGVEGSVASRTIAMRHSAELASRSPPRLSRTRSWVCPELTGIGEAPVKAANDFS